MADNQLMDTKVVETHYHSREKLLEDTLRRFLSQVKFTHNEQEPTHPSCACSTCDEISLAEFVLKNV